MEDHPLEAFGYTKAAPGPKATRFEVNRSLDGVTLLPSVVFLITLDDGQQVTVTFSPDEADRLGRDLHTFADQARASHFD